MAEGGDTEDAASMSPGQHDLHLVVNEDTTWGLERAGHLEDVLVEVSSNFSEVQVTVQPPDEHNRLKVHIKGPRALVLNADDFITMKYQEHCGWGAGAHSFQKALGQASISRWQRDCGISLKEPSILPENTRSMGQETSLPSLNLTEHEAESLTSSKDSFRTAASSTSKLEDAIDSGFHLGESSSDGSRTIEAEHEDNSLGDEDHTLQRHHQPPFYQESTETNPPTLLGPAWMVQPSNGALQVRTSQAQTVICTYFADITKLTTDVIVDACNARIGHGGSVAKAISKAAGLAFQKACKEYMQNHKSLAVGEVVETDPGRLPCKKVYHACGPVWLGEKSRRKNETELVKTVKECLDKAERGKVHTLAMPAIGAGKGEGPKEIVAKAICSALLKFLSESNFSTPLQEIHLVDVNTTMVRLFEDELKRMTKDNAMYMVGRVDLSAAGGLVNTTTSALDI